MAILAWDRILETCVRRGATDILLVPGCPPQIRLADGLRSLQIDPCSAADLQQMAAMLLTPENAELREENYATLGFSYGKPPDPYASYCRIVVFGQPSPEAVFVMASSSTPLKWHDEPLSLSRAHFILGPSERKPDLQDLLRTCIKHGGTDVLLVPTLRPLLRLEDGLHWFDAPPVTGADLQGFLNEFQTPPYRISQGKGHLYTEFQWRSAPLKQLSFRITWFGQPTPGFAVVGRLADSQEE